MEFPVVFRPFGLPIPAHAVFEVLAYFVGFRVYLYQRRTTGDAIDDHTRLWTIAGGCLGALLGSKLLGVFEHPELWQDPRTLLVGFLGTKTIVGGLLGGLLGVELFKKLHGVSRSTGDLYVYPLIIGMAIGRIGCFLAGVTDATHGAETTFFLGMDLGDGLKRHPTALYEILFLMTLSSALHYGCRRFILVEGALFKVFLISYLFWRFCIEFLKPVHTLEPVPFSAIQVSCILGFVYYHRILIQPSSLLATTTFERTQG